MLMFQFMCKFFKRIITMHHPDHSHAKILFICKKRITDYGVLTSSGLLNSARMVNVVLQGQGISCKLVDVEDSNSIDREVHNYKPTHVVLEAIWCPPYKLEELTKLYPKIKWTVRNHSKIPFLSGEGQAFDWIFNYQKLTPPSQYTLSSNSIEATHDFKMLGLKCAFTPNFYVGDVLEPKHHKDKHDDTIHIGCFGALRLLKNNVIQAIAAINFAEKHGKKLMFHINVARQEMNGDNPLKNIRAIFENVKDRHTLVEHGWLTHDDFMKLVQKMDLGLQVSYTETFNIVAGDFVFAGVPIAVSPEIDWMPKACQADPNSIESIIDVLDYLYKENTHTLQYICLEFIEDYNSRSLDAWLNYLK